MSKERTEALDNAIRLMHNRQVREYFKDIPDGDLSDTPRASTKRLLVLEDNDSSIYQLRVMDFFKKYCEDANEEDIKPLVLPWSDEYLISATDKPHVHIRFVEKKSTAISANRKRVEALISFRLLDKTVETITQANIDELKREINLAFPPSYQLKKGRIKYSYRDKVDGYELVLALLNESEAKEVITKTLGVRDKTPEWKNLKTSTSEKNFNTRQTIRILNQNERLPLERPVANCYLKDAVIALGKWKKIKFIERAV